MSMGPSGPVTGEPKILRRRAPRGPRVALLRAPFLLDVPPHGTPQLSVLADLLLQVLYAHPSLERLLCLRVPPSVGRPAVVPFAREEPLHESPHFGCNRDDVLRVLPGEQRDVVDVEDSDELLDRLRVVVHAEVDPPVVEPAIASLLPHDEEGRGLLPAAVPARLLPRGEGREEPHGEVALRRLVRAGHPPH